MNRTPFAALLLLAAALPAGALFEAHLDPLGVVVADRLTALPSTGGTKDEAKQRKALQKATAALALVSEDRAGDMSAAKKAAAAVQKTFLEDAGVMGALETALDEYRIEAEDEFLACQDLLAEFPAGAARAKLEKKLLGVENLLAKEEISVVFSAKAALLGKVFKKLVPIKEALEAGPPVGPCPEPGIDDMEFGTVTALVGGEAWSSTDLDVILVVDSDTMAIIQLGLIARRPEGDEINFTFDSDDYTGPAAYPFNTSGPYILGMNYYPIGPGFTYQALNGVVTVTEFSFTPTVADPTIAIGRLVGTFSFNGCTTYRVSGDCPAPDEPIAVTSGTFEVCNFYIIYY